MLSATTSTSHPRWKSPNIDALAKKGAMFWQRYSPAPTRAPSRGAIVSGVHPARSQYTHVVSDISELLKKAPTNPQLVKHDDGSVRDTLLWHFPNSLALESTIRIDDYKLVRNYDHVGKGREPELELFRLYVTKDGKQKRGDIEEAKNLAASFPKEAQAMNTELSKRLTEMKASYPYYNPHFKSALPNKEKVPSVLSSSKKVQAVEFTYRENGAKLDRAQLIYTLNGEEKVFNKEWFRAPAKLLPRNKISATLHEGTTHYVINLIDENNFLVSYPDVDKATRTKNASPTAQAVSKN